MEGQWFVHADDGAFDRPLMVTAASWQDGPEDLLRVVIGLTDADRGVAVFDFDDRGFAVPALDRAITTFYLRQADRAPEEALLAGYAQVVPLPQIDPRHFEAMVAARQLMLANSLLASLTAHSRAEAQGYLRVTLDRLRYWLQTGRFTRTPRGG